MYENSFYEKKEDIYEDENRGSSVSYTIVRNDTDSFNHPVAAKLRLGNGSEVVLSWGYGGISMGGTTTGSGKRLAVFKGISPAFYIDGIRADDKLDQISDAEVIGVSFDNDYVDSVASEFPDEDDCTEDVYPEIAELVGKDIDAAWHPTVMRYWDEKPQWDDRKNILDRAQFVIARDTYNGEPVKVDEPFILKVV